jgi:DNA-binding GntR family transcriptional regulator
LSEQNLKSIGKQDPQQPISESQGCLHLTNNWNTSPAHSLTARSFGIDLDANARFPGDVTSLTHGVPLPKMTKLRQQSLTDRTVSALRDAIFDGSYLPGQRLVEEDLASQLGVSRNVIREAFYHLEGQGLISSEHNHGKTVAALSIDDIAELIPLRLLMESLAASWAAYRITPASAEMLRKLIAKFEQKLRNYSAYVEMDFQIHKTIWELAGNKQMVMMLERLAGPMIGLASRAYSPMLEDLVRKERESQEGSHARIIEAICNGQPTEARHAMQTHILSLWKIWINKFSGSEPIDPKLARTITDAVVLVDSLAGVMPHSPSASSTKNGD